MTNPITELENRPEEYQAGDSESLEDKYEIEYFKDSQISTEDEDIKSELFTDESLQTEQETQTLFETESYYVITDNKNNEQVTNLLIIVAVVLVLLLIMQIYKSYRRIHAKRSKSNN